MNRRSASIAGALVTACALLAPSSLQARPADAAELAAISALYSAQPECSMVVVSDIDPTWARWDYAPGQTCEQTGNGFGVAFYSVVGRWSDIYQGSDPTNLCDDTEIPDVIGVELAVCAPTPKRTRSNTRVLCLPRGRVNRVAKRRPSSCVTLGPSDAFAEAANLARLKWRGWGSPRATATGITRGFHLPLQTIPVRVTLTKPELNDCGGYNYTRLVSKSRYGQLKQSLPAVCDERDQ